MNLTIKTNYTVQSDKEIPIPSFWKAKSYSPTTKDFVAVLDVETMVKVFSSESFCFIINQSTEGKDNDIAQIDATYEEATEEEFFEEFNKAYKFLQLNPVKQYYANGMVNATI